MPFRVKIEVCRFGIKSEEFPSLGTDAILLSREFPTLTEALQYGLGPEGFRKEIAKTKWPHWTLRWVEVLPDGTHQQLEDMRHFEGDREVDDGLLWGDVGPFLLDRATMVHDDDLMRATHPEWWRDKENGNGKN